MFVRIFTLLASLILAVWPSGYCEAVLAQQELPSEILSYADMVLYNGKILTADDNFTIAEAVAIRDGKFLAVGTTDRILQLAGPNTRRIDLKGKTVAPGFIETHAHGWAGNVATAAPRRVGELRPGFDAGMFIFYTKEKGLEQLKKIADQAPPGKWLWLATIRNNPSLTITAKELDTVTPNNPVVIQISPQEAVVNSKALQAILEKMPGIRDMGGLMKDQKTGEPTGQFRGNAFGVLFYEFFPWTDLGKLIQDEKENLQRFIKNGVTTKIGRAQGLAITILNELHTRGELPLRVRVAHEFLRMLPDAERFLKRMGNLSGIGDDWLKIIGTVEQQVDGGSRVGAILTKKPKLRVLPGAQYGQYGANYWGEEHGYSSGNSPRENIIMAGRYGWNVVSLHSYGDKVAEISLEAFEEGMKQHPPALTKRRWVLDHNWMHDEQTIEKAKRLNVLLSVLPWFRMGGGEEEQERGEADAFGVQGDPLVYMYGADWLSTWSPAKSLIEAGLKPMAETAGPPLQSIQSFVTRKDSRGRVWGPQERVDRKTALWMKTRWAAYYTGEEDRLGSIEAGKLADFVVLGGDYMTVAEDEISKIPVLMTVVGGKVVYEEPGKL